MRRAGCGTEHRSRGNAVGGRSATYVHPVAYLFRKQLKSLTFRMGAMVEASQLAYESPAAKRLLKQRKSLTLRMGTMVELSQLG